MSETNIEVAGEEEGKAPRRQEVDEAPTLDIVEREDADGESLFEFVPGTNDFIAYARTPRQMVTAQRRLIEWSAAKLENIEQEIGIANDNLFEATEAKIRTQPWKSQLRALKRKKRYYTKIHEALAAGYAIVPDFPINVIAVRTKRTVPKDAGVPRLYQHAVTDERPQELDVGMGEYVNPALPVYTDRMMRKGKEVEVYKADDHFQELELPLRFVRPQVLRRLGKTLQRKIFDSIGVLPNTRRNVDPMIIGTIEMKEGYRRKQVSFLIQWWVPTESL